MPPVRKLQIDGQECKNQHDLVMAVLLAAGAVDAETLRPKGTDSQIADAVFMNEAWIFEIKSIVADRPNDPEVQVRIGSQFAADSRKFGGPVIIGTVNVGLDQLPSPVAHNLLRMMGSSVQKAAEKANKQIAAGRWRQAAFGGCFNEIGGASMPPLLPRAHDPQYIE